MYLYDIVILTDHRYDQPTSEKMSPYVQNILTEDNLLKNALEKKGLRVHRTYWDNPNFDWTKTRFALFRTTWDYFDRFAEFSAWLDKTAALTTFINPLELIKWNMDKHYLRDLKKQGINIPDTMFIEKGDTRSLKECIQQSSWQELILKPAVSGAGRHTYRFKSIESSQYEPIFRQLIAEESMLMQAFQRNILSMGEVALMFFDGQYSHAILKRAKQGDFRVQDDFGGTVHDYIPTAAEIEFVEKVLASVSPTPVYARVDMIWDNAGNPAVSELEMIEPELWMRTSPKSADLFAEALYRRYF